MESSQAQPRMTQPIGLGGQHSCLCVHVAGCCGWQGGWTTRWKDADIFPSGLHSNACLLKPDHFGGLGPFFSEPGLTLGQANSSLVMMCPPMCWQPLPLGGELQPMFLLEGQCHCGALLMLAQQPWPLLLPKRILIGTTGVRPTPG